jgi:hypothetical protein
LLAPRGAGDCQGAEDGSVVWPYYIIIMGRLRYRHRPAS